MISLKINNIEVEVEEGTKVLEAARKAGIEIPTMCYLAGLTNNPSCMICLVKESTSDKLMASCALPAEEGMDIITDDEEIFMARKESLELMLSDHVGDCQAPCQPSCPASMNIPAMNRYIQKNDHVNAIKTIKTDIAIPLILGYICPAPCEKACKRTPIDDAVSICNLKKHVAFEDLTSGNSFFPEISEISGNKVAVIGTGPAGLSCAYYLRTLGHSCTMYDKNDIPGGTLYYDIPNDQLPKDQLKLEIDHLLDFGINVVTNTFVDKNYFKNILQKEFDAVVFATGNYFDSGIAEFGFSTTKLGIEINKDTFSLDEKGVFACGNIIRSRRMAITSAAQGKQTALSVDKYLRGELSAVPNKRFNSKFGKLFESEFGEYLKESVNIPRIKLSDEKLDNFSKQDAISESERCMYCDCRKPDTCKLRIFSEKYSVDRSRYAFTERRSIKKYTENDIIIYEPEKCIKCNICVEICSRKKDTIGFTNIGRGMNMEINVPFGHTFAEILNELAVECAQNCPTAAISLK